MLIEISFTHKDINDKMRNLERPHHITKFKTLGIYSMKFKQLVTPFTVLLFSFAIIGCASNAVDTEATAALTEEQKIDEQLKDIYVSNDAKVLVATESNEEKLREELVCKSEKQIGTKFKKKVCYTRAELEAKRAASKQEANELQRQRSLSNPPIR